jgi:hypothetical protein
VDFEAVRQLDMEGSSLNLGQLMGGESVPALFQQSPSSAVGDPDVLVNSSRTILQPVFERKDPDIGDLAAGDLGRGN